MKEIEKGASREKIEAYFRQVAKQEASKTVKFEDTLDPNDKGAVEFCIAAQKRVRSIFTLTSLS